MESTLRRLFRGHELPDPNKPENLNYFKAKGKIFIKGLAEWYSTCGQTVIELSEMELVEKVVAAITHPRNTEVERNKNLAMLDEILLKAGFIDKIISSFEKDKKETSP